MEPIPTKHGTAEPVYVLAKEATWYIKDVVEHCLSQKPGRTDYLHTFRDACQDDESHIVHLFTLNHDTLLEDYLCREDIVIADGFEQREEYARFWSPGLLDKPTSRIRLIKLHGSVSWQWFHDRETGERELAIRTTDYKTWRRLNFNSPGRAEFLAGTFNKMLSYTVYRVYLELYLYFWQALKRIDQLIICGYGFGDKGINARVVQWMADSVDRNIIVIDPKPEADIMQLARGMITKNWESWKIKGRLSFIGKGVEEVNWNQIKDCLLTS